jgi:hypothetical protein
MKLMIYTAVWKRPEITEICFMGIKRLQKVKGFEVGAFAVISEEDMIPLCERYGIDWCMYPNHPLGAKKNHGIREALRKDFSYMIEIGSDDLLKNEVLTEYKFDAPVIGLMDFALINTENGKCKAIHTNIPKFGAGRAIQRYVLESFKLWEDSRCRGLDNSSCRSMAEKRVMQKGIRTQEPLAISLRSAVNLWSYDSMEGGAYPLDKALSGLSEEEVNAIRCLAVKNKSESLIDG